MPVNSIDSTVDNSMKNIQKDAKNVPLQDAD